MENFAVIVILKIAISPLLLERLEVYNPTYDFLEYSENQGIWMIYNTSGKYDIFTILELFDTRSLFDLKKHEE
jgi:hypothetical protein